MKKLVEEVVGTIYLEEELSALVPELQGLMDTYGPDARLSLDDYRDCGEVMVLYEREETGPERTRREKEEARRAEQELEYNSKREAYDREIYEKLKARFEPAQ